LSLRALQQERDGERTRWRIQWVNANRRRKRINLGDIPKKPLADVAVVDAAFAELDRSDLGAFF